MFPNMFCLVPIQAVLKRYPDIGNSPKRVLSNPPKGSIEPLQRFYHLAPKKVLQNPSERVFRTSDRVLSFLIPELSPAKAGKRLRPAQQLQLHNRSNGILMEQVLWFFLGPIVFLVSQILHWCMPLGLGTVTVGHTTNAGH